MKFYSLCVIGFLSIFIVGCGSEKDITSSLQNTAQAESDLNITTPVIKTITQAQSYSKFQKPEHLVMDNGYIYISDAANNCIRRIAPDGTVLTVIGSTTGAGGDNTDTEQQGTTALFSGPTGLAIDASNPLDTHLYIADTGNNKILDANITGNPQESEITVIKIAGSKSSGYADDANGSLSHFYQPHGLEVIGSTLYVADTLNNVVRDINITSGTAHNVGTFIDFSQISSDSLPIDLTSTSNGTNLLVLLKGSNKVYDVPINNVIGAVDTNIIGLNAPEGILFDVNTNILYISNTQDHTILDYNSTYAPITTPCYAGDNNGTNTTKNRGSLEGTSTSSAMFNEPIGLYSTLNELYIVDRGNHKIRKILKNEKIVRTVMGSGEPGQDITDDDANQKIEEFFKPEGLTVSPQGNLYFCDTQNQKIRHLDLASTNKSITATFIGQQTVGTSQGDAVGTLSTTLLHNPTSIVGLWDSNQTFYIVDSYNHSIKRAIGSTTTLFAGNGSAGYKDGNSTQALFNQPYAAILDGNGNLYVTDTYNHRIRKITSQGIVTTLAGSTQGDIDGQGANSKFSSPTGITYDGINTLYVVDNGNNKIRKVTLSGTVSTQLVNNETFNNLYGVAISHNNKILFVSDIGTNKIFGIDLETNSAVSILNDNSAEWVDGNKSNARINHPKSLFYDKDLKKMYISDTDNNLIRIISF
ncbi:hypothetical protein [Sulfurimonas sp.]|jgi:trimeric autotransporter adhesin|uniref:hypothetical protein n=1 Tax=Sulfurimonas sp. TaxID=2022749 RepID=UPI0025F68981|nr:hypothetical protein [Sulfurimonas sp.]MBT5935764.1 hypothetical protein [Sulfurimonas sp.]